jgi:ATP-dependent Lon protease
LINTKRNEKDIEDVPESVRDAMTFHLAGRVEEAIKVALEPIATEAAAAA